MMLNGASGGIGTVRGGASSACMRIMSGSVRDGSARASAGVTRGSSPGGDALDLLPAELRRGPRALPCFQPLRAGGVAGDGARVHALEDRRGAEQVVRDGELPILPGGTRAAGALEVA